MTLKKTLMAGAAGAALFAFAAPVATTAEAGKLSNGAPADLKIYGQVGRGILYYDDGNASDFQHVDADVASTRFGFDARAKLTESLEIRGKIEVEIESNTPNAVSQNDNRASNSNLGGSSTATGFTERKQEISFVSKSFGRLTLGQQSEISDGMSDGLDLGGAAGALAGMDTDLTAGGIIFRNNTLNNSLDAGGRNIRSVFKTFDGGRTDAIQYETPNFNGLRVQIGTENGGNTGVGVLYDGKFGSFKVRGRGFYEAVGGTVNNTEAQWQVGASVKHDSGIALTALYGSDEKKENSDLAAADRAEDETVFVGRVSYTANMNTLGATGVGLTMIMTDNRQVEGDEGFAFGGGVFQDVKKAGAALFANVMVWDVDRSGTAVELEEIVTVFVGGRLKF